MDKENIETTHVLGSRVPAKPVDQEAPVKREDFFIQRKEDGEQKDLDPHKTEEFLDSLLKETNLAENEKNTPEPGNVTVAQDSEPQTLCQTVNKNEQKKEESTSESSFKPEKENLQKNEGSSESREMLLKKRDAPFKKLSKIGSKIQKKRSRANQVEESEESDEEENRRIEEGHPSVYDRILLMKLTHQRKALLELEESIKWKITDYEKDFFFEQTVETRKAKSNVVAQSVPICADVTSYDFSKLIQSQQEVGGRLFDVVMMDPPWQLATSQPSRGVAIAYSSLSDDLISRLPITRLQTTGFLLIWVINAKYSTACRLFRQWGYSLVDEVAWVKRTVTGKIAKGHGFYLQHAKETCLVGFKGDVFDFKAKRLCRRLGLPPDQLDRVKNERRAEIQALPLVTGRDVIFSERRGQSQKPNEIYDLVEGLVPDGFYLEIFGRRNNIHPRWVTVGTEL